MDRPKGKLFPMPGTWSGWILAATAYRVLPELAGRIPTLVGFGLAFDIVQNRLGLASMALQALVSRDSVLLAGTVLAIQVLVRLAVLPVQLLLFSLYPRRRWSIT
jgi:ABC-type dipeptide/oligopeptide/nickel transport system permease component